MKVVETRSTRKIKTQRVCGRDREHRRVFENPARPVESVICMDVYVWKAEEQQKRGSEKSERSVGSSTIFI